MKVFKTALLSTFLIAQLSIGLPVSAEAAQSTGDKTQQTTQQTTQNDTTKQTDGSPTGTTVPGTDTNPQNPTDPTKEPVNPTKDPVNPTTDPANPPGNGTTEGQQQPNNGNVDPTMPADPNLNDPSLYSGGAQDTLVIMMNSDKMYHNGQEVKALQPLTVKNGTSYIALRSIAEQAGFVVKYDSKTKETILMSGQQEIRFKTNSATYRIDGKSYTAKGAAYQQNNVFMVPLTSITSALKIPYTVDNAAKKITMNLTAQPIAEFTVSPKEIFAEQTTVTYTDKSSDPRGLEIVDQRWEGNNDIFMEPGQHTITHWVMNANGVWSEPYSVTITVQPKNLPPVAFFETDKDTYKMGELITFSDQSTDDENAIVSRDWTNKSIGYFEPGEKTITLRVTDRLGQSSEYTKKITITDETLYPHDDFFRMFSPVGDKYTLKNNDILNMAKTPFVSTDMEQTLLRSNSPESLTSEGVLFRDTQQGAARFLIHHKNITSQNLKVYAVVTNPNFEPTTVTIRDVGFAGPNEYEALTGKLSVERYLKSMNAGSLNKQITLQPGETKVIFDELSAQSMKPRDVVSLMGDVYSELPVNYQVVALAPGKDVLKALPNTPLLPRDNVHIRGTYQNANRLIEVKQVVGEKPSRLIFADNNDDLYLNGIDNSNGMPSINMGNYGVMYTIRLNHVAPNTLIAFNARGGVYKGVFVVNGQMTEAPTNGTLANANESSVLYRTGDTEESVTILFTPVSGSNLPVNLLFYPLEKK